MKHTYDEDFECLEINEADLLPYSDNEITSVKSNSNEPDHQSRGIPDNKFKNSSSANRGKKNAEVSPSPAKPKV